MRSTLLWATDRAAWDRRTRNHLNPPDGQAQYARESPGLFHERARRDQMQREGVDLVAGTRIDLGDDRIVAGNDAVGMAGQALDGFPADAPVADTVDDR